MSCKAIYVIFLNTIWRHTCVMLCFLYFSQNYIVVMINIWKDNVKYNAPTIFTMFITRHFHSEMTFLAIITPNKQLLQKHHFRTSHPG